MGQSIPHYLGVFQAIEAILQNVEAANNWGSSPKPEFSIIDK